MIISVFKCRYNLNIIKNIFKYFYITVLDLFGLYKILFDKLKCLQFFVLKIYDICKNEITCY